MNKVLSQKIGAVENIVIYLIHLSNYGTVVQWHSITVDDILEHF